MLIITLGLGKGLENGVIHMFSGFASNSVFVWGSMTSKAYKGFKEGRRIELEYDDIAVLEQKVSGLELVAPRNQLGGWRGGNNVIYKDESGAFSILGDVPEINQVYQWLIPEGRFINEMDMQESRKVCVVGKRVVEILFKGNSPLGEYISINGVNFQVVGTFKPQVSGHMAERDEQSIIIPYTTFGKAFNAVNKVNWLAVVCDPGKDGSVTEQEIKAVLRERHKVHPDDPQGFGSFNVSRMFKPMQMTFVTVRFVAWFVGLMTLFAGIIGVSNILLVTVKERTKELGIRRAIGAKPGQIILQIVLEAVTLTFFAGMAGLLTGIWIVEGLGMSDVSSEMFRQPEVEISVAVIALIILVISGCLAGILPANRAIRVKPVDALRAE
jgi:putative ABC transport system permease protein